MLVSLLKIFGFALFHQILCRSQNFVRLLVEECSATSWSLHKAFAGESILQAS